MIISRHSGNIYFGNAVRITSNSQDLVAISLMVSITSFSVIGANFLHKGIEIFFVISDVVIYHHPWSAMCQLRPKFSSMKLFQRMACLFFIEPPLMFAILSVHVETKFPFHVGSTNYSM